MSSFIKASSTPTFSTSSTSSSRPTPSPSLTRIGGNYMDRNKSLFQFSIAKIQNYERVYQRVLVDRKQKQKNIKALNIYSDLAECLRLCGAAPTSDQLMFHFNQHLKSGDEFFTFGDFLDILSRQYDLEKDVDYEDIFAKFFVLNSFGERYIPIKALKKLLFEMGVDQLKSETEFDLFVKHILGEEEYNLQMKRWEKKKSKNSPTKKNEKPPPKKVKSEGNDSEFFKVDEEEDSSSGEEKEEKPELFISLVQFLDLIQKK
ncbi:predicted protein [Naegleria gruberi]|uniref:Predicted protein n=1 Tax=Naegleria gruberi TaxID=5762 RepID=D2VFS8_NAEGR|nr:uncharacterized protein NAEGRDRAFT_67729 [Naegleria gruberi]EFC44524.1 predicted protein [Naegleria gruberi]|eukprot:XP_002677268.1 predicted protein [Naegleria gruberi strain NEG-M]